MRPCSAPQLGRPNYKRDRAQDAICGYHGLNYPNYSGLYIHCHCQYLEVRMESQRAHVFLVLNLPTTLPLVSISKHSPVRTIRYHIATPSLQVRSISTRYNPHLAASRFVSSSELRMAACGGRCLYERDALCLTFNCWLLPRGYT